MPFTLIKPNATMWDLGPGVADTTDRIQWYADAKAVIETYGKFGKMAGKISDGLLVNLVMYYVRASKARNEVPDKDFFMAAIEAWCRRPMTSIDRLANLLDKQEPLEFVGANTNKQTLGSGYKNSTSEVREERKVAAGQFRSSSRVAEHRAVPRGAVKQAEALKSLDDRGIDLERWPEYFQHIGVGSDGYDYYLPIGKSQQ